jgi:hypothetical protein
MLGLTLDELRGRRFNDSQWTVTEPDGTPVPEEALPFNETLRHQKELRDRVLDVGLGDGRTVRISVNAAPLLNDRGDVDSVVLTLLPVEGTS